MSLIDLACYNSECAPPPVGTGGSSKGSAAKDPIYGDPGEHPWIHQAMSGWKYDPEELRAVTTNIIKAVTGERAMTSLYSVTAAASLLDGISEAPQTNQPLYRGIVVDQTTALGKQITSMSAGDTLYLAPSGFSGSDQVGADYALAVNNPNVQENSPVRALFELEPGAKALNIDSNEIAAYRREHHTTGAGLEWEEEHITAGGFEVVDVEVEMNHDDEGEIVNVHRITLRQVEPLGIPEGSSSWGSAINKAMKNRVASASAIIELACYDSSCAPPPVGVGGSSKGAGASAEKNPPLSEAAKADTLKKAIRYSWKQGATDFRNTALAMLSGSARGPIRKVPAPADADLQAKFLESDNNFRRITSVIMDAIVEAPVIDNALYRGLKLKPDDPFTDQVLGLEVGDMWDMPPSGFTPQEKVGTEFTRLTLPQVETRTPVLIVLQPGARALDIDTGTKGTYAYEEEHLVAGSFEVVGVEMQEGQTVWEVNTDLNPIVGPPVKVITIRQTEPLGPPEGAKTWWETTPPEKALTSALIELACHSAECAPPPVGVGGSSEGDSGSGVEVTKELLGAVHQWKGRPETVRRSIKALIEADQNNQKLSETASGLVGPAQLLDALVAAPKVDFPLYRGMYEPVDGSMQRQIDAMQPGAVVFLPPSGFSKNPVTAAKFTSRGYDTSANTSTFFMLKSGAQALNIDGQLSVIHADEKEHIVAGAFMVMGKQTYDWDILVEQHDMQDEFYSGESSTPITVITLEQVETFGPPENDDEGKGWGHTLNQDPSAATASALIELACYDATCAPPPVGTGGSSKGVGSVKGLQPTGTLASDRVRVLADKVEREHNESDQATAKQQMEARGRAMAYAALSGSMVEPRLTVEFNMLSSVIPVEEGWARGGTPEADALIKQVKETFPGARVGMAQDVNVEAVNSLMAAAEKFPLAARKYVGGVMLGHTENPEHLAAFGPSPRGGVPSATIWFSEKVVAPSVAKDGNPDGSTILTQSPPEKRHEAVVAHEMGHLIHAIAAVKDRKSGERSNTTNDPRIPKGIAVRRGYTLGKNYMSDKVETTRYGAKNAAETVAETFAAAMVKGFGSLTPNQQQLVTDTLDRADLDITQMEFAVAEELDLPLDWYIGDSFVMEEDGEPAIEEFACHSAECAPPPVGVGGSKVSMTGPSVSKAVERNRSAKQKLDDKEIRAIAVEKWKRSPALARVAMTDVLNGDAAKAGDHFRAEQQYEAAMLMDEVVGAPAVLKPLFRGMHLLASDALYDLEVGQTIDLPPSGFTPKANIARGFTDKTTDTIAAKKEPILYQLVAGSHALNIDEDDSKPYAFEREHIVAGSFEVVGVEEQSYAGRSDSEASTLKVVTLRQVEPLGPPEGHDSWSAKIESERDWDWKPDIESVRLQNRTAVTASSLIELACYDASCAPPPVGVGGSTKGTGTQPDASNSELLSDEGTFGKSADGKTTRSAVGDMVHWWKANPEYTRTAAVAVMADRGDPKPISDADLEVLYPRYEGQKDWLGESTALYQESRQWAATAMNKVAAAPVVNKPLYRGMTAEVGSDRAAMIQSAKVGDSFDWVPSGFSTNPEVAKRFTGRGSSDVPALFVVEAGAKAWDIEVANTNDPDGVRRTVSEEEHLAAGTFEVVGVSMEKLVDDGPEVKVITLRQTQPLEFPVGGNNLWASAANLSTSGLIELACYDASCAPPPVGTGGSKKGAGLIIPKTERYIVSRYWDAAELDKTGWEEPNPDAATSPDADPAETRGVVWDAMRWWKANPQKIRTASFAVLADEGNQQPISETDLDVLYPRLNTQTAEEWWNGAFNLYDTNRLHAAIVMNKVAGAPVVGVPLYRGITAEVGSDRAAMIKTAKVGDTFDWIPSGFSASEDVAAGFTLEYGQRGSKVPALFVLESGAKAWGIERPESAAPNEFAGRSEEEFIAAGSFEIVGVEMRTVHPDNPDRKLAEREVKVITIRQTEPLGFPPGPAYQMAWRGNVWR